jgi:hypothetical protein
LSKPKESFRTQLNDRKFLSIHIFPTRYDSEAEVVVALISQKNESGWESVGRLAVFRSPNGKYTRLRAHTKESSNKLSSDNARKCSFCGKYVSKEDSGRYSSLCSTCIRIRRMNVNELYDQYKRDFEDYSGESYEKQYLRFKEDFEGQRSDTEYYEDAEEWDDTISEKDQDEIWSEDGHLVELGLPEGYEDILHPGGDDNYDSESEPR